MKGKVKKALSGLFAFLTIFTSVIQPMTLYAAEPEKPGYEAQYPALEQVIELLDQEEIVTAEDYEVERGSSFDVTSDFSGLKISDEKVRVVFHEAKNEARENYDGNRAGTYKAVYFVEPVSGHPSYHICRNLIVKEPATEKQSEKSSDHSGSSTESGDSESEDEDSEPQPQTETETEAPAEKETKPVPDETEVLTEKELDAALKEVEQQETVDAESGLSLGEVLLQATEQGVDIQKLDTGESVSFTAVSAHTGVARSSQAVTITQGGYYYYADYGLGSYVTSPFTVSFGSVKATAFCIEPSKPGPGSGTYQITKLEGNRELAKVCYYGTEAAGKSYFFSKHHTDFPEGKRFIVTHLAASYANGSSDAFYGTNSTGQELAMELYHYAVGQPDIPDVEMSFSDADVTAYADGSQQRTKEITFRADKQQTITMKLPDGVKLHNVSTGKVSAAGADVTISGGTKFYLTAPLTQTQDVSGSWKTKMQGSITKDYSAYKITTNTSSQDLALVFGEGVEEEKYVSFSVKWIELAKVKVTKVDSTHSDAKLAGAVFGIYSDKECKNLITKMPATDKNGSSSVEIIKTQDTVYVKEITAPAGYRVNTSSYNVKLVANQTNSVTVPDQEQFGQLTVYKEGEVLIGADVQDEGVTFQYEKRRQEGAVYDVYAGADIVTAYGAKLFNKGDLVKGHLTTDSSGTAVLKNLHLGTYRIKEVQAPENFVNAQEEKTVTLSYAGQNVETVFGEATFQNERQKAEVSVCKEDQDTRNPLDGGIFGLYAGSNITNAEGSIVVPKGTLLEKAVTGAEGKAVFSADLPIGFSYEVRELKAPEGYVRNPDEVYSFQFSYTNDSEAKVSFTHTFANERVKATIVLQKKDAETNQAVPQGDATLEKAVYGLYAREDILHPDGATGVLYKAGEKVATLTTDAEGKASVENLYLGNYYVKEITPPTGYLTDKKEYELDCSYQDDRTATIERECISLEQVKKQPFSIIKVADNGETDAALLAGAGFSAYLLSDLTTKEDGSYDFDSAKPVVIGENGATEIFTDKKGYACSIALPYGTYLVRETTTPHNYKPVADFIVRITEHSPNEPQVWRVLLDKAFEAKLKIIKQDDETKKPVLHKGTEFRIYDMDKEEYVEQVTTYPTTTVHTSFFTDEKGYLILPQNLKIGHYRIEEVHAPYGYTLNENYYEIAVDSDTAYQVDPVSGDVIIEVVYENHPVKGRLKIVKQGEMLQDFQKEFVYETKPLAGATFEVYAAENIYTADFQKDEEGNRILEYAADELVGTVTTDENGEAFLEELPLGSYKVVEVTAPEGFVLNQEAQVITLSYEDQDTPVVEQEALFENERQKVEVSVVKKDAETKTEVEGAVFGLYAKEDILVQDEVILEADTLIAKAVSDEKGTAVFQADLPFGSYYIRELDAPEGYVSSEEAVEVTAAYQGQEIPVVEVSSEFENEPTKISVKKTDLTTGVELDGAKLTVLDQDGNVVDSWTSVKGKEHIIERLTVGGTYTLREEFAPYGYLQAEEVTFTVEDTAEIQKVEMKDEVPTGTLIINKKGEFLEDVTLADQVGGWISHLFEYVTGALKEVTFEVYAREDIQAADKESEDYYQKDELVATITTDAAGIAKLTDLPLGRYYVKEKETANGYVLDKESREIDLTYADQTTAEVTYCADWQNQRQKVEVSVLKKEKDSERVLSGAVFALAAKEDITNKAGKVILEAGEVIEEKATGDDGTLIFEADLPIGFSYTVTEISPAPGFATTDEVQEFTFTAESAEKETISYEFTFEDKPTVFEFTKTSLTDGKEIEGAKLTVTDENGKVVDEWVSAKEPHVIKELVAGKTYTMTEVLPAPGYVTAESIQFTVEDTAEVQKIEMKDDVTKVEVLKTDTDGKELPGAKLSILDESGKVVETWTSTKEAHRIEMLTIGNYVLHEEAAPEGYLVAEDVKFEVKDTGEIQKVVMKDEKEPEEETEIPETLQDTTTTNAPKTGDNTPVGAFLLAGGLGLAGAIAAAFRVKGKKKKS
ncbi:SpaA isopeptide-forming pilin-related protein [Enterocloster clostridioformis]|uniref:SpaA isopeptide-forming pilin-related protein n=1 Tax=Enterocloster clostridioformis TaxID=1531 RepID=UPI0026773B12|nr:SpaA isopeptide-forming pilin-related protein [Enterocloster clostridioformis]